MEPYSARSRSSRQTLLKNTNYEHTTKTVPLASVPTATAPTSSPTCPILPYYAAQTHTARRFVAKHLANAQQAARASGSTFLHSVWRSEILASDEFKRLQDPTGQKNRPSRSAPVSVSYIDDLHLPYDRSLAQGLKVSASRMATGFASIAPPTAPSSSSQSLAVDWVRHRTAQSANEHTLPCTRSSPLAAPSTAWWKAHPSAKIKHRIFQGSKEEALSLANKLRKQLSSEEDTWSRQSSKRDPKLLQDLPDFVPDGRASPAHKFKLQHHQTAPRQFLPRRIGSNPEYSRSSNREAIEWFSANPVPLRTTTLKSPTADTGCPRTTTPWSYQPASFAATNSFAKRMTVDGLTPSWAQEVSDGLPAMHDLWA